MLVCLFRAKCASVVCVCVSVCFAAPISLHEILKGEEGEVGVPGLAGDVS